jgi:hypothetical protein
MQSAVSWVHSELGGGREAKREREREREKQEKRRKGEIRKTEEFENISLDCNILYSPLKGCRDVGE